MMSIDRLIEVNTADRTKEHQPLVRPEACVCGGQQRSQGGVQLI